MRCGRRCGHTSDRCIAGARRREEHTYMLVLEEGGPESDRVVCAGVRASTKASGHAVDGKAGLNLGSDDVTGRVVCSAEEFVVGEAKRRRRGKRSGGGNMAGNGGDLCEREIAAGECDWLSSAVEGLEGRRRRRRKKRTDRRASSSLMWEMYDARREDDMTLLGELEQRVSPSLLKSSQIQPR